MAVGEEIGRSVLKFLGVEQSRAEQSRAKQKQEQGRVEKRRGG